MALVQAVKKTETKHGVKNYRIDRPDSEDSESIKLHIAKMQTEMKKSKPRLAHVQQSMRVTIGDRRDFITGVSGEVPTVVSMMEVYPGLFDAFELLAEFYRLTEVELEKEFTSFKRSYKEAANSIAGIINSNDIMPGISSILKEPLLGKSSLAPSIRASEADEGTSYEIVEGVYIENCSIGYEVCFTLKKLILPTYIFF